MSFKLSDFTQKLLDLAKKSDLLDIADHYGLPNFKKTMLNHEIKKNLVQFFEDEEYLIPQSHLRFWLHRLICS